MSPGTLLIVILLLSSIAYYVGRKKVSADRYRSLDATSNAALSVMALSLSVLCALLVRAKITPKLGHEISWEPYLGRSLDY